MIDSSVFLNNKNISKNTSYKNDDSSDSSRIHHNTIDQFDLMNTSAHTPGSEMDMNISEFPLASNFHQNNMSDMHSYRYMQQNTQMNTPSAMDNSQNLSSSISKLSMSSGEVDNHSKQQNFTNGNNYTSQVSPLSLYIIKIQNVPSDLSPRECHLLFALMIDSTPRCIEILQDGGEKYIKAVVSDLSAAVTTAILLESKKSLFGPFFPFKSFIQLFDNRTMQQIPFNDPSYSSKNKLNPGYSKDADPAHLKFVDPFYSNYYDRPVSNNAHATMNNTNIWHNQNTMGGSGDMTSNFLRHNFDTPQYGLRFSGMTEYDAYAATNQLQNSRASKNNTNYDTYSPPVSASENQPAAQQQMGSTAENSTLSGGRMDSLGDIPVSQLRKASLSMTTASHGTDPRMNIAAGSVDGSILRLEEYIISSKHLRNMPIIYASIPGITEADLDALARVPAPTNPADQNPPCNTLYVGNLSPDTVESDMSDLFEKEEGFLRLSFRSKPNNNKNNHGPMCFVEFEEIIFAARALAKLYGVEVQSNHKVTEPTPEIPNDSGIKKMVGIRLSFTKNPLGVRNSKPTPHHVPRQNKQHNDHEPVNDYRRNSRASSQSSVLNTNTNGGNKGSRQSNNVTKETMNSNNWRNAFGDHSQSRDSGRHKKKREDSVVSDPRYTFGDNAVVFDRKGEDDVYKQFR